MNVRSPSQAKNSKQQAYKRGIWAEYLAACWLILKAYRILSLRYKTAQGEIDIVARRGNHIIFIEVKARRNLEEAQQSVTLKQRQRIAHAANLYMKRHPHLRSLTPRYDIVAITPKSFPTHVVGAW